MKKFITTIVTTCLLAMTSCETTISDYNTEIEDVVRTFLASTELRANYMQEDDAEEFVDDLYREFETSDDDTDFKSLLEKKANKVNRYADEMLKYYERLSIDLTEPVLKDSDMESKKKWSFQEKNSKISFEFTLHDYMWETMWEITPIDEEEVEAYMLRLMDEYGIIVEDEEEYEGEIISEEMSREELVLRCVNSAYQGLLDDKLVMTKEFYNDIYKVFGYGSQDAYAALGFWRFEDGTLHNFEFLNCDFSNEENAIVSIKLTTENQEIRSEEIALYVYLENGEWRIGEICGMKNGEIVYAFSDMLSVEIADEESDHEGNY